MEYSRFMIVLASMIPSRLGFLVAIWERKCFRAPVWEQDRPFTFPFRVSLAVWEWKRPKRSRSG